MNRVNTIGNHLSQRLIYNKGEIGGGKKELFMKWCQESDSYMEEKQSLTL